VWGGGREGATTPPPDDNIGRYDRGERIVHGVLKRDTLSREHGQSIIPTWSSERDGSRESGGVRDCLHLTGYEKESPSIYR